MNNSVADIPLYVDLDGTLIKTDLMFESLLLLLKKNIFYALVLPFWLIKGKTHLKLQLAKRIDLPVSNLPLNTEFYSYLRGQKEAGREIILISGSSQRAVTAISEHIKLFDASYGSDEDTNLKAKKKLQKIRELSGERGFAYAGNSLDDIIIWQAASQSIIVNCYADISQSIDSSQKLRFDQPSSLTIKLLQAIRPHHWLKNILVFVPLVLSHQILNIELLSLAAVTFISFSLCASSVYVLNDLIDLNNDRCHWRKRNRPFASGDLPLIIGFIIGPLFFLTGAIIALFLPLGFQLIFLLYWFVNLLYSFYLKRLFIVDIFILSFLYNLRIIAGAESISIETTNWLLGFSFALFLGLAIVKRVAELHNAITRRKIGIEGRAYKQRHLKLLSSIGIFFSAIAVSIFAFYISAPETTELYDAPLILWAILPLLTYLLYRIWYNALNQKMNEDPIIFAATDLIGQLIVIICGVFIWLAS